MSSKFGSLQKKHQGFLQRQLNPSENDKPINPEEVRAFINEIKANGENISQIEEREQLRANLRYWANYVYGKEGIWPETDLPETISTKKEFPANNYRGIVIPLITLFLVLLLAFGPKILNVQWATPAQTATAPPTPTVSILKYGFDVDKDPMGWVPQETDQDSLAVTDIQQEIRFGEGSLRLEIELIGNRGQKSKGEVFVNLLSNPPLGETDTAPFDLEGKPITMLVYVPSDAIGIPSEPNGIQIFVRDSGDKSQYSVWMDLTFHNTNEWTSFTWRPVPKTSLEEEQKGARTAEGFDPSRITIVGLKIGAGDEFDKEFRGSIWIDEVTWP
jgi:hypothetical protein